MLSSHVGARLDTGQRFFPPQRAEGQDLQGGGRGWSKREVSISGATLPPRGSRSGSCEPCAMASGEGATGE